MCWYSTSWYLFSFIENLFGVGLHNRVEQFHCDIYLGFVYRFYLMLETVFTFRLLCHFATLWGCLCRCMSHSSLTFFSYCLNFLDLLIMSTLFSIFFWFHFSHWPHLFQDLQKFPRVHIKLRLKKKDESASSPYSLNVRLENANGKRKTPRAFAPRFPKVCVACVIGRYMLWPMYWICLTH